jgi:p-hydroxybenzoate 3-monooxygenase
LLEQGSVDLLNATGLGERMRRESLVHDGIEICFRGQHRRINIHELTGRQVSIYGQQEIVKDIIAKRLADGGTILFEAQAKEVGGFEGDKPFIRFEHNGSKQTLDCDYFAWLGMLAAAAPTSPELIYCHHPEGFALFTMRSSTVSRLYLQVAVDEDAKNWSEDRIWSALERRLGEHEGLKVSKGKLSQIAVTPMRSFVTEPMRVGRMFLAGDSAHIVPPTGAKGMNLAIADVSVLARAFIGYYKKNRTDLFDAYSDTCMKRVWRAQHFSWWMTSMMHPTSSSDFDNERQIAELDAVTSSRAGSTFLAENYSGLPLAPWRD